MYRTRALLLVAMCAAVTGCTSPGINHEAPGRDVRFTPKPVSAPQSMREARMKLEYSRAVYHDRISNHLQASQNVSSGLVWLGAGILGLASGNVHKDVILGTSLIGGTTYTLSKSQLDARKIDIATAALEALDCAYQASLPVIRSDKWKHELSQAQKKLALDRDSLSDAIRALDLELRKTSARPNDETRLAKDVSLTAARAISKAALTFAKGDHALRATDGFELAAAVDRIDTQAAKANASLQPDIAAIKNSIAGLPSFANIFASGAGLDVAQVAARFTSAVDAPKTGNQSGKDFRLVDAVERVRTSYLQLEDSDAAVHGLLIEIDAAAITSALEKCNVAPLQLDIALSPASLELVQGPQAKGFSISGGVPPYEVVLLDRPADNSLLVSGAVNDTVQVFTTDKVKTGAYHVRVRDSGRHERILVVTVEPVKATSSAAAGKTTKETSRNEKTGKRSVTKTAADPKPVGTTTGTVVEEKKKTGSDSAANPSPETWAPLIAAFKRADARFTIGTVMYGVETTKTDGSTLRVWLTCSKPAAKSPPPQLLKDRLAMSAVNEIASLKKQKLLDANLSQIIVAPVAQCYSST